MRIKVRVFEAGKGQVLLLCSIAFFQSIMFEKQAMGLG